jgi:hypothetical protein
MISIVKDGVLFEPMAAYADGILGDAMIPVKKSDPRYESLLSDAMLEEQMQEKEMKLGAWG